MNFGARVSGTVGGPVCARPSVLMAARRVRIGLMGHMGPEKAAPDRQPTNPKVQGRSGVPTRAACVSRLATLFAGHPRTGSLCSMGPPHRVDWRLSRPILMIFANEVSEIFVSSSTRLTKGDTERYCCLQYRSQPDSPDSNSASAVLIL
jgi:hypothetical protein